MIEIEIDGRKLQVQQGSMIMHAAEQAGLFIPHFCYHKKLSIAANCRMCLVDVEKMPKPMPACATPVTQGMVVRTHSDKAVKAQQSVMEFLLINHPLDCPICDQGGECQLQDLAVGYGKGGSRYDDEKRVVAHKDVGPLISMQEMSRCIQCTRCVRFGQEIAGVMELGMSNRGEHSEIETFVGQSVDSELSGNMIDLCPVGALTSKPFRYTARTWELSRRKSISPHDSTGANLIVQVKNHRVMRVVPFENEAVNECWLADRDRFSYEALNGPDRLTEPMLKREGRWQSVSWQEALEFVAQRLKSVRDTQGAQALGALVSPHSTLEELHLATALVRALGSDNIDHRLRHAAFETQAPGVRYLGMPIADLAKVDAVLIVGSQIRKDHPLFATRIRQAARAGAQVHAVCDHQPDWAMPMGQTLCLAPSAWVAALASVAAAVAEVKGLVAPQAADIDASARAVAQSLTQAHSSAVLLGTGATHHSQAATLLRLAHWLAENTGARLGVMPEAANTVGAAWVGAQPSGQGLNAGQMLQGGLNAVLLLNVEPQHDARQGGQAEQALAQVETVVTLSPFKTNLDISDVLLPIAPFTETSGTFVNAEGRVQSFHAVVRPLGETRPAWKVLRALANVLELPGFAQDSSQAVLREALAVPAGDLPEFLAAERLSNAPSAAAAPVCSDTTAPTVATLYSLDALVRRAPSLQQTADARAAVAQEQA